MPSRPYPRRFTARLLMLGVAAVAVGPLTAGPAIAQSAASRRDQPTPATLPSQPESGASASDKPVAPVAPPSAISSSTAVVDTDRKGKTTYTNPLDHLPERDRAATGGRRE